ncbi:DUF4136 domain-containing protein [Gammaproteobacteria bacterium]|jgi:hypothetical protein|nr:DUF4136 domain-containing protein [Gammaproteobacteria bacterium]MDA7709476.1 DUF4136 domain-containing protein [Gammaproteobacteria bacterium]MDA7734887.1 DUF4136 domain-containing protein [Gammaproteobacteria bacterium]MDA7821889.1 DUF4136 domain-containing protein [Gammaproteobacteria bacterium]MDA7857042.1 DUF4136 domain-containing protein [Gammaproteobacteria bacterium]|tara:strand:- start:20916 stop:21428 length:513 start_codon:yes stop_codon:yes gene_type:complete
MKIITKLASILILVGCATTQSNIEVDSIDTFNLSNYNDFYININESNISAEINPIELERFKVNLKNALETRGLKYSSDSSLIFNINLSSKDKVQSDRSNFHYSRYYWNNYMYDNNVRTITENILRINLKDASKDTTLWTVVTVWRSDYSSAIANEDKSDVLVDEIMISFL